MRSSKKWLTAVLVAGCVVAGMSGMSVAQQNKGQVDRLSPETLELLTRTIAFKSETGHGDQVFALARHLTEQLLRAGFQKSDIDIIPVDGLDKSAAMVVRYQGKDNTHPIVLLSHMDVVTADPTGWTDHEPYKLIERDGYFYGRGIADMKGSLVVTAAALMELKRKGFIPKRGLQWVITGDEETDFASSRKLARQFKDADYVINIHCCSGVYDDNLKPVLAQITVAERLNADFTITASGPGGHSSQPIENPISDLAKAISAITKYEFPVQYSDFTRETFREMSKHEAGALGKAMATFADNVQDPDAIKILSNDPRFVGQLRTTCVPTMVDGGYALNAIPKLASANINCRIWPGVSVETVQKQLEQAIGNTTIKFAVKDPQPVVSHASTLKPEVRKVLTEVLHRRFPGIPVVPSMTSASTDMQFFRNVGIESYGFDPMFAVPGSTHTHGVDERVLASEFAPDVRFWVEAIPKLTDR